MALNQVVMPGFAAFHVGIQASKKEVKQTSDRKGGAADNHTSEVVKDKDRNIAKRKKKTKEIGRRSSSVDSE
jgi:hypothetical protein